LLVGDRKNHFVAAHRRHQRQPHAGVAGSAFNNRAARLQQTTFFGVIDHRHANAVFHRAAGIDVVRLDIHLCLQPVIDSIEAHQRRAANGIQNIVAAHEVSMTGFR